MAPINRSLRKLKSMTLPSGRRSSKKSLELRSDDSNGEGLGVRAFDAIWLR